jgi:hypothetical protein
MKKWVLILVLFISFAGFSQNNHIVKTEDGRRVLLKADFTWEYIDMQAPTVDNSIKKAIQLKEKQTCSIKDGFEEPKLNSKIQAQLKRGRATIEYVKKKVAKDYNCDITDVILLKFSEQKAKAVYHLCANGKKVTYKRIGNTIIKSPNLF